MKLQIFVIAMLFPFISIIAQKTPFNPDVPPIHEDICKRAFHQHDFEK